MATWIVHLRLAENLLELIDGLDACQFAVGSVAPDSGLPDENWRTFDPPVAVTHFRIPHGDDDPVAYADLVFYRRYLLAPSNWEEDGAARFSFLLGYFLHLVADNLWRRQVAWPAKVHFAAEFETVEQLWGEAKRDWYGLDFRYVRTHPDSIFWGVFQDCAYDRDYLDFMPGEAVRQRLDYIKAHYRRTDEEIERWCGGREGRYLSQAEMDRFVAEGTRQLHAVHRYLWEGDDTIPGLSSVLELPLLGWEAA